MFSSGSSLFIGSDDDDVDDEDDEEDPPPVSSPKYAFHIEISSNVTVDLLNAAFAHEGKSTNGFLFP